MKLLPDSHILIWALAENGRLSQKVKSLVLSSENDVYFSVVSIWEITIKHIARPGHVKFSGQDLAWLCLRAGFTRLDLELAHIHALETLVRVPGAPPHKDPFDRMLIAQAKAENMTHDALLSDYNERCVVLV